MITKTLLALSGVLLLAVPAAQAQHRGDGGRSALDRGYYGGSHGYARHGGYHGRGRYYYYGGVPYFYPFVGLGFGYPAYYYGEGFGGPYGYGYGAAGEGPGVYEGRIANERGNDDDRKGPPSGGGPSLPEAVQRQLSKKGYYKGSIDGQFGPASRDALSHFQRDHDLKQTGRIDEGTLDSLGFTDHR